MLEHLFTLIRQESQHEIIDNPVIPNELNNHAIGLATDSIFSGLQGRLSEGGLQDVMQLFAGNTEISEQNPIVNNISNNFVGGMMQKFGIDQQMATSIAAKIIPGILGKLVSKTNDPNDNSFNINDIIGSLIGGTTSQGSPVQLPGNQENGTGIDFGGILKNLASGALDSNKDGNLDLKDLAGIISKVSGGRQTSNTGSGGVMDILKGFMK
jgi:hypothetical protein